MPQDLVGLFSINALYSACDQLSREQPCFFVVVVVVVFFFTDQTIKMLLRS